MYFLLARHRIWSTPAPASITQGADLHGKEKRDRLLIRSFARPSARAKRRVQTGNPCELREPVR